MNLRFYASSVTVCVRAGVYLTYTQEENEAAGSWTNGGNFKFSFCPSHFAPLIPAIAEALCEGSLSQVCSKWEKQETDPCSDHDP